MLSTGKKFCVMQDVKCPNSKKNHRPIKAYQMRGLCIKVPSEDAPGCWVIALNGQLHLRVSWMPKGNDNYSKPVHQSGANPKMLINDQQTRLEKLVYRTSSLVNAYHLLTRSRPQLPSKVLPSCQRQNFAGQQQIDHLTWRRLANKWMHNYQVNYWTAYSNVLPWMFCVKKSWSIRKLK